MSTAVARTIDTVTLHARCDSCGTVAAAIDDTASGAADRLAEEGWSLDLRSSAALCPACQASTEPQAI